MISIVGAPHVAWTIDRVVRRASSDRHASVCTRARKYRGIYSFFRKPRTLSAYIYKREPEY
jgi:hypothetical protein